MTTRTFAKPLFVVVRFARSAPLSDEFYLVKNVPRYERIPIRARLSNYFFNRCFFHHLKLIDHYHNFAPFSELGRWIGKFHFS